MQDYCEYSYKNLLGFLHNNFGYDGDSVDYAEYLLSMSDAASISDMMAIYNKVFLKTAYYIFARTLPSYWFITESWKSKQYFYFELNQCLNENILRWYKSLENPTRELCISCLVNLRQSERVTRIQNEIVSYNSNIQLSGQYFADKRNELISAILKVRKLTPGTGQYRIAVEKYAAQANVLLQLGYEKSIEEKKFEEIRKISIQKEIERREERERSLEEEEAQYKRKERRLIIRMIIAAIVVNIICALILLYGLDIGKEVFFLEQAVFFVAGLLFLTVGFLCDYHEKKGHKFSTKSEEGIMMFYVGGYFCLFCPNLFLLGMSILDGIGGFFGLIIIIGLIALIPKVLLTGKF